MIRAVGWFMALFLLGLPLAASASAAFAIKEGKPCIYCHTDPNGGPGLNPRGIYYAQHNDSFKGYNEEAVMGTHQPPMMELEWSEHPNGLVKRIALGDTQGNGKLSVVQLLRKPGDDSPRELIVSHWDKNKYVTDFQTDVTDPKDQIAIGKFSRSPKALIVLPQGYYKWDGKKYRFYPSPRTLDILGAVHSKSEHDYLMLKEGSGASSSAQIFAIDSSPSNPNWLQSRGNLSPSEAIWAEMHARTKELEDVGMPPILSAGEIVGLWNEPQFGTIYVYAVQIVPITTVDPKTQKVVLEGKKVYVVLRDAEGKTDAYGQKEWEIRWRSPAISGRVLDITQGDPHGSGTDGLAVLSRSSGSGAERTLSFYKLIK